LEFTVGGQFTVYGLQFTVAAPETGNWKLKSGNWKLERTVGDDKHRKKINKSPLYCNAIKQNSKPSLIYFDIRSNNFL
jgi:hypothetical protein